jgi:hypothetical protein
MTKEEIRIFEALFKGVSTRFGLRTIEKCFENPDFLFCHSFQNLRLGGVKRRFWKDEPTFQNAFTGEALLKGVSTPFGQRTIERRKSGFHLLSTLPNQTLRFADSRIRLIVTIARRCVIS